MTSFTLIVLIGIANPVAMSAYSSDKCSDRMLNHAFGRYADRSIVLVILSVLVFAFISAITVFNTLAVLSVTGLRPACMRERLMFTSSRVVEKYTKLRFEAREWILSKVKP